MMLALVPDIAALLGLLLLLGWLRRRHPEQRFGLWLAGLLLIFVEEVAHALSLSPVPWPRAVHVVALNCFALAGSIFFWGSFPTDTTHPMDRRHLLASVPPLLAFLTLYGMGVTNPVPYYILIGLGLMTGVWTVLRLQLSLVVLALRVSVLLLMAASVQHGNLRLAAYIPLAYTYGFCAWSFLTGLPRESLGRTVIVLGFAVWSLCFLVDPWVSLHPSLLAFTEQVWSLQPFAVTIGMLLVMFEQQVERNKHLALHDQLTGLPNRRLFEDRLRQATLQAQRTGQRVALLVLDLDGFKGVNDSLGHATGDALLCEIAHAMRNVLRSYNTVARVGGDEFAIVAPDLVPFPEQARSAAEAIAATIHGVLAQPFPIADQVFRPGCSIGCAIYPDDGADIAALHRLADSRMYENKRGKRTPAEVVLDDFEPAAAQ